MDYRIYLVMSLLIISSISKAIMDTLNFHFHKSIFKKLNSKWFNSPEITWKNKYEWFPNSKILTWIICNPLVFVTDAWHLFGLIRDFSVIICFTIVTLNPYYLLIYPLYRLVFHIFFTFVLTKK